MIRRVNAPGQIRAPRSAPGCTVPPTSPPTRPGPTSAPIATPAALYRPPELPIKACGKASNPRALARKFFQLVASSSTAGSHNLLDSAKRVDSCPSRPFESQPPHH